MGNHPPWPLIAAFLRSILCSLALLAWLAPVAAVPLLINYQGVIDGTDSPVAVTFEIHDSLTGQSPLWTETHELTVKAGRISVLLGSLSPIQPTLFQGSERYLALSLDGNELSPRQRIVSVAYSLNASHAADVAGESITPRSIVLSAADASWDSAGTITSPLITADSIVVGSTPVINSQGVWVGPAIDSGSSGLVLKSIANVAVDVEAVFFFNSKWLPFSQFDTFLDVPAAGKLDISFVGRISCKNPYQTRITLKQVSPINQFLGKFGNTSGATSADSKEGATVYNQAIVDVAAGTYRVFVEHISASVIEGTLRSGNLTIRYYE